MTIQIDDFDYVGNYYEIKRIKQGINNLTAIILNEPDNYTAYERRGFNRVSLRDYQGAIDILTFI